MKKSLSLLLIALLIVSSFGTMAFAADEITYGSALQSLGIVKGDAKGNLNGDKPLTRGELVAIINNLTTPYEDTFKAPANSSFSDVPTTHWAYKIVERAKANNVTQGVGNGKFGINDKVTYKQAQAFMINMLGYKAEWSEVEASAEALGIYCDEAVNATSFTRDMMFEVLWHSLMATASDDITFIVNVMLESNLDIDSIDLVNVANLNSMFTGIPFDESDYLYGEDPIIDMSAYNLDAQVPALTEDDQRAFGYQYAENYMYYYDEVSFNATTYTDYMNTINETLGLEELTFNVTLYSEASQTYNDYDFILAKDGSTTVELTYSDDPDYKFDKTAMKLSSIWKSEVHPYDSALTSYVLNLSHPQDSSITVKIVITFDSDLSTWESTIFPEGL